MRSEHMHAIWNRRMLRVLVMLVAGIAARAQAADRADATERSMAFVEKSSRATELFNENKTAAALAIFQDLVANYGDLDEDGYAAVGMGDCLATLGRDDEARAAYSSAVAAHPELANEVSHRLIELELAGKVTDATIDVLRQAASAEDESRHAAQWRLGRALQSRAKSLLDEASRAFRSAAGEELPFGRVLVAQADLLDELGDELGDVIERADAAWGSARRPFLKRECDAGEPTSEKPATEKLRAEWLVRAKDGRRIEFQGKREGKDGDIQVSANGKAVKLTRAQQLAIQRHEERMNAILLEAADDAAKASGVK